MLPDQCNAAERFTSDLARVQTYPGFLGQEIRYSEVIWWHPRFQPISK
jgi:hypothetical protein